MIIFGLDYIKNQFNSDDFSFANEPNKIQINFYNEKLLEQTQQKRAILCDDLSEVLQCNAALVDYIIPNKNILKDSVKLAEQYLFDSKIMTLIKDIKDLNHLAFSGVDCVLLSNQNSKLSEYFAI